MQYIVFDLEATCWEGNTIGRVQEIIEIGALRIDAYGSIGDTFQRFVRPVQHPVLSPYCRNLTGIEQSDVNAARTFQYAGGALIAWIEAGDPEHVLCSWGSKDRDILMRECRDHKLPDDWLDSYIDVKAQYHQLKGLKRRSGLRKSLLREGITFDGNHHRALDDAANLGTLFVRYIDEWH